MTRIPETDFEEYGLSRDPFPVSGRLLLLTVDFEAFAPEMLPLWLDAMHHWAVRAERSGLRSCFFLSVEDALRIRATGQEAYSRFLEAMRRLDAAGSLFYAHSHFVFDPRTGQKQPLDREPADLPRGYGKRRSIFYDVHHRHHLDWAAWLTIVRESYERVLSDAGCRKPRLSVFRAGGWDYGDCQADLSRYIAGLAAVGFHGDSSACRGRFETPTWRVGTDFGRNVFWLANGLIEIAPTWAMDMGVLPLSAAAAGNLLSLGKQSRLWTRRQGACVVVLHFDHLFRSRSCGRLSSLHSRDLDLVRGRINCSFRVLALLRSVLRLRSATFEDLDTVPRPEGLSDAGGRGALRSRFGSEERCLSRPVGRRGRRSDAATTASKRGWTARMRAQT